jgi:hypothetical protein
MRHQDLTINHILESWTYANAAARTSATGFLSGDVGRIAYQTDTGEYFRLTAVTPAWAKVTILTGDSASPGNNKFYGTNATGVKGYNTLTLPFASFQPANPTGTSSTTGVMMGMGGTGPVRFTPARSGVIAVIFLASVTSGVANAGAQCQVFYGTSTAPANGVAGTGTAFSTALSVVVGPAASSTVCACQGVGGSFAIGTSYWFDLWMRNVGVAGLVGLTGPSWVILEL